MAMKMLFQRNTSGNKVTSVAEADVFSSGGRLLLVCLILLLVVLARVRLLEVPLERDEGEYAYMGQLLLQGVPPYAEAYNMKFPGTYVMYALMMSVFGQTVQGIHLGFLVLNCATILLIYFLCKKIANDLSAIIASGSYAILSLSSSVLGFAAHATHFVVLASLGGSLLLLSAAEKNRPHLYFLSGGMFGLALLMKQPGVFFIAFGASYIMFRSFSVQPRHFSRETTLNLAMLLFASLLPLLITGGWLYLAGVFNNFWFWTVQYATAYGSQVPLSAAFDIFQYNLRGVVDGFYLLWIISGLGFLVTLFHRDLKERRSFIVLFSLFSFLSICPGFYFRQHYFITLLPALSLCVGIFINQLQASSRAAVKSPWLRFAGLGIFIAVALIGASSQKEYLLEDSPVQVSRKIYSDNPFVESAEIARFIEARSSPADKIAVFGSEPQIYFYSRRRSATGHIYTYGMMEGHNYSLPMQKEMVREVESAKPKFIVHVNIYASWLILENSDTEIFSWLSEYLRTSYRLVGVADIISPDRTVYTWDDDARNYRIQSRSYVLIFERA